MEKHTPKSPANSGLPPSQSPNDATARSRPGAKGKGPSYNEARCANTRTREHVRVLGVDSCARCGEDLTDTACIGHQRRTLVDIVFEKVVRHADAEIKHCPRCHQGGFVLHGFLNPPNEITAGLDILPAL